jgi:hypothetical protein
MRQCLSLIGDVIGLSHLHLRSALSLCVAVLRDALITGH